MITIKTTSEKQRIAVLRNGHFKRLTGPGVVFLLNWPGKKHLLINVGDHGRLVSVDQAKFGNDILPVVLQGSAKSGDIRISGFQDNMILATAEDVAGHTGRDDSLADEDSEQPRFKAKNFWIGLPVILLFCAVCWMGLFYAATQIFHEQQVYKKGVVAIGTVIKKIEHSSIDSTDATYYVTYTFRTSTRNLVNDKVRIDYGLWNGFKVNGPIIVRYIPDQPEINLPDGTHMSEFYYWAGGVSLAGSLLFAVILFGMLIKKIAGGYRGETDQFLGEQ
jgi:hypothetical protein